MSEQSCGNCRFWGGEVPKPPRVVPFDKSEFGCLFEPELPEWAEGWLSKGGRLTDANEGKGCQVWNGK